MENTYLLNGFKGKNRWWRYLVMIILIFIATQLASIPYVIICKIKAIQTGVIMNSSNMTNFNLLGIDSNLGLFLLLLPFAIGLITLLLLIKPMHARTVSSLLSSRKKFNWNKFFFAILIWGALVIIGFIISYFKEPSDFTFQFDASKFILLVVIAVLFLSMQSAFEEALFRGYMQQGLAVLSKNAWIPLIMTSFLFGLMHISNPEVKEFGIALMLPQYMILGLFLGILVIMDEGLELAIGVHVINNVLAALLYTHESSVLQTAALFKAKSVDPTGSLYEILITSIIFIFIMFKKYKWDSFKKLISKIKPEIIND